MQASELMLALKIKPDESIEVPLMQLSDLHRFTVKGQFVDGAKFQNSYSPMVPSDGTLSLRVTAAGAILENR